LIFPADVRAKRDDPVALSRSAVELDRRSDVGEAQPPPMTQLGLLSILATDRIGLVAAIADRLFSLGINLRDASFAVLGGGADFSAVCELPPGLTYQEVEEGLRALPELAEARLQLEPYAFAPDGSEARITHRITVSGGDQLGLVARLAEIFAQYEANIVRLEARQLADPDGPVYVTRFAVAVRPDREGRCLSAVTATAGALQLSCEIEAEPVRE
jgi:glycine cleavage system transcriptional repressor